MNGSLAAGPQIGCDRRFSRHPMLKILNPIRDCIDITRGETKHQQCQTSDYTERDLWRFYHAVADCGACPWPS
jgi:hypothetical protein